MMSRAGAFLTGARRSLLRPGSVLIGRASRLRLAGNPIRGIHERSRIFRAMCSQNSQENPMKLLDHRTRSVLGAFFVCTALACIAGGDAPKPDPKSDDKQVVDSKPQKRTPATSINFNKELNLPFPTLRTLGTRVEAARRACDPVALAQSANELSVAENVSEKKASLTSLELIKESAELAKVRNEVKELEAVYNTQSQITSDDSALAGLKKQIGESKQRALQETQSVRASEEPKNQPRRLLLNNYTDQ